MKRLNEISGICIILFLVKSVIIYQSIFLGLLMLFFGIGLSITKIKQKQSKKRKGVLQG